MFCLRRHGRKNGGVEPGVLNKIKMGCGNMKKIVCSICCFIGLLFLSGCVVTPPNTVWISEAPHIVIFHRYEYRSPFGGLAHLGYMYDNGVKTRFFVSFWKDSSMTFFAEPNLQGELMRGFWRNDGRNMIWAVDGDEIIFTRTNDYDPPNFFEWHTGLEAMFGIWETADGMLQLDFTTVIPARRTGDPRAFRHPIFIGTYNTSEVTIHGNVNENVSINIIIRERERANIVGQTNPHSEELWLRAIATVEGDELYLQITDISGNWNFPDKITLYRVPS